MYTVIRRKSPDSPVYKIRPEKGGLSRDVHRNLLLPCDSLPVEKPDKREHRTKTRIQRAKGQKELERQLDSDSDDDEGFELYCKFPNHSEQNGSLPC